MGTEALPQLAPSQWANGRRPCQELALIARDSNQQRCSIERLQGCLLCHCVDGTRMRNGEAL